MKETSVYALAEAGLGALREEKEGVEKGRAGTTQVAKEESAVEQMVAH